MAAWLVQIAVPLALCRMLLRSYLTRSGAAGSDSRTRRNLRENNVFLK